jgi:hypothetical protein
MAIFSKYPIKSYGFVYLADKGSGNQCLYVDVKKGAKHSGITAYPPAINQFRS